MSSLAIQRKETTLFNPTVPINNTNNTVNVGNKRKFQKSEKVKQREEAERQALQRIQLQNEFLASKAFKKLPTKSPIIIEVFSNNTSSLGSRGY